MKAPGPRPALILSRRDTSKHLKDTEGKVASNPGEQLALICLGRPVSVLKVLQHPPSRATSEGWKSA